MRTLLRFASSALFSAFFSFGAPASAAPQADSLTPPRLGLIDGQVSYWRTGAPDWVAARLNTPLAAGDTLYADVGATFELQIGSQAYVRGGSQAQIGLVEHDPDFLQFKLTSGQAAFDLRALAAGATVEINTPNAVFTIARSGYYRLDVDADSTRFITRRGGSADITNANGERQHIGEAQELEIDGNTGAIMLSRAAPPLDVWDRWNFARSDAQQDSISARYVPAGVYGTDSLDRYGAWQQQPDYGAVWVPSGLSDNWAPYSDGNWVLDPYYGWSWIDAAPWGWAPFHYGRWVRISQRWAWAPGPRVIRPIYSPALVAFFGFGGQGSRVSISISQAAPAVGWVALGWGEPVVPWWGGRGYIGTPHWAGWGGPRVINNVVINNTNIVNITHIHYQNTRISDAVVSVPADRFGHGTLRPEPVRRAQLDALTPVQGALPIRSRPVSLVAGAAPVAAPPRDLTERPVMRLRRPQPASLSRPERHRVEPTITVAPSQLGTPAGVERPRPIEPQHGIQQPGLPQTEPRRVDAPLRRNNPAPAQAPRPPAPPTVPMPNARDPIQAMPPAIVTPPPPPRTFGHPRFDRPQTESGQAIAVPPAPRPSPPPNRIERIEPGSAALPAVRINEPMPRPEAMRQPLNAMPARPEMAAPAPRPFEPRPFEARPRAPEMRPAEAANPPQAARLVPAPHKADERAHHNPHDEGRTDKP